MASLRQTTVHPEVLYWHDEIVWVIFFLLSLWANEF